MSDEELRRWVIELVISKWPQNWLSMFIISEILIVYVRDGKLPPFNDENNLDLRKWLENLQRNPNASDEEPAHA